MHSSDSQRKASKGTVQIKSSNNRLQLVFSFEGKRHYLSLGLQDSKTNRKVAEARARQIELDVILFAINNQPPEVRSKWLVEVDDRWCDRNF